MHPDSSHSTRPWASSDYVHSHPENTSYTSSHNSHRYASNSDSHYTKREDTDHERLEDTTSHYTPQFGLRRSQTSYPVSSSRCSGQQDAAFGEDRGQPDSSYTGAPQFNPDMLPNCIPSYHYPSLPSPQTYPPRHQGHPSVYIPSAPVYNNAGEYTCDDSEVYSDSPQSPQQWNRSPVISNWTPASSSDGSASYNGAVGSNYHAGRSFDSREDYQTGGYHPSSTVSSSGSPLDYTRSHGQSHSSSPSPPLYTNRLPQSSTSTSGSSPSPPPPVTPASAFNSPIHTYTMEDEKPYRGVHLDESVQPKTKRSRKAKVHECELCHKVFPRPSGLATHMNSHSGSKPYKCPIPSCVKRFAVRSNAKRHLRTHGIYPAGIDAPAVPNATPPNYTVSFEEPLLAVKADSTNSAILPKLRWIPQAHSVVSEEGEPQMRHTGARVVSHAGSVSPSVSSPLSPVSPSRSDASYDDTRQYQWNSQRG